MALQNLTMKVAMCELLARKKHWLRQGGQLLGKASVVCLEWRCDEKLFL